jgi:hypothetical protein
MKRLSEFSSTKSSQAFTEKLSVFLLSILFASFGRHGLKNVLMFSHKHLLGIFICSLVAFSAIAADPAPTDPIVGRWRWFNNRIYVLNADGTTTPNEGHWKCVSPNQTPRKYVIDWREELNIDTLYLEKSGAKLSGKNQKGRHITADRLPN